MSSHNNNKNIEVRELQSPSAVFRSIPKQPGAPYVAGLEPERYGPLTRLGRGGGGGGGADAADEDAAIPGDGVYYGSSTRGAGYLMLLAAVALLTLWLTVYNVAEVPRPTTSYGNGAPPVQGYWGCVEFSLDKIRILETLKNFAVTNVRDVSQWLRHPGVALQVAFQLFAAFGLTVTSICIARAVPIFPIFCVAGIAFISVLATLGDAFMVVNALLCFKVVEPSSSSQQPTISAAECRLPLMMHAVCVNAKWLGLAIATALLVIPVRFRGGFSGGIFRWVNLTAFTSLPVVAHALRVYLWYSALDLPSEAVAQHGWKLTHQEDVINMCFNACCVAQVIAWVLFGVALIQQDRLVVLEQDPDASQQQANAGTGADVNTTEGGEAAEPKQQKSAEAKKND